MRVKNEQTGKPPYLIGILCILPLLGALVGIALILYGVFKYKDRLLVIIGSFGVLLTVVLYSFLFYDLKYGKSANHAFAKIAQSDLNILVMDVEFYKFQNGAYPDSLEQLEKNNEFVVITDPFQTKKMSRKIKIIFQYQKIGGKYTLYSVGIDGIPNTADDIYPSIGWDSAKFGLIKR